jgi:hypothetical protein
MRKREVFLRKEEGPLSARRHLFPLQTSVRVNPVCERQSGVPQAVAVHWSLFRGRVLTAEP